MGNPTFYRIRNWDQFQHYRDRNPKWVKLYYDLLSSRDWVSADDAGRALMMVCLLVASRHGGQVPNDAPYLMRVGYLNSEPNINKLAETGFLELPKRRRTKEKDASILIRNARPEKETYSKETQVETDKKVVCADAPRSKRKSRTALPEIWPNDLDRAWALKHWREKGREDLCELADDQMKEARDHHLGAGTMSADWPATWRTWATRAIRYNRKGRDHDRKPTAHENMQRGTLLALDRIAGRQ